MGMVCHRCRFCKTSALDFYEPNICSKAVFYIISFEKLLNYLLSKGLSERASVFESGACVSVFTKSITKVVNVHKYIVYFDGVHSTSI